MTKIMTKADIIKIVQKDTWMMDVLRETDKLNLPDWMIGAGFLRNKVWDYLHGLKREVADTSDIDVAYFDAHNMSRENDEKLSERMKGVLGLNWEIVNQAYTHTWHNGSEPYKDTEEAISEWVETATCVAVTLVDGKPKIIAPHGIDDLVNLIVRRVPTAKLADFNNRYSSKKWVEKWPKLKIVRE